MPDKLAFRMLIIVAPVLDAAFLAHALVRSQIPGGEPTGKGPPGFGQRPYKFPANHRLQHRLAVLHGDGGGRTVCVWGKSRT